MRVLEVRLFRMGSEVQNWSAYETASLPDYGRHEVESGRDHLQLTHFPSGLTARTSACDELRSVVGMLNVDSTTLLFCRSRQVT